MLDDDIVALLREALAAKQAAHSAQAAIVDRLCKEYSQAIEDSRQLHEDLGHIRALIQRHELRAKQQVEGGLQGEA